MLKDAGGDKGVPLETSNKNRKKKNGENDDNAKSSVSEVKTDDPIVQLKDKKKKKQSKLTSHSHDKNEILKYSLLATIEIKP